LFGGDLHFLDWLLAIHVCVYLLDGIREAYRQNRLARVLEDIHDLLFRGLKVDAFPVRQVNGYWRWIVPFHTTVCPSLSVGSE